MAYDRLQLYNDALDMCEERQLATVVENRKPRRLLDGVWNGGGVKACLEEGQWTWGLRTIDVHYDPGIQPNFGYQYAFQKPADYVRTAAISASPYFNDSFTSYNDEAGYWWADIDPLFVKIISTDPQYGGNLDLWPETFRQFVAAHFASKIVGPLSKDKQVKDDVFKLREMHLSSARSKDTMNQPPGFTAPGQWSRARRGNRIGGMDKARTTLY